MKKKLSGPRNDKSVISDTNFYMQSDIAVLKMSFLKKIAKITDRYQNVISIQSIVL